MGATALVGFLVTSAAPAFAADPYPAGDKPPQVLAQSFFNDGPPPLAGSSTPAGGGGGGLAFTGGEILVLVAVALAAAAIGFLLWRAARQRPAPSNR